MIGLALATLILLAGSLLAGAWWCVIYLWELGGVLAVIAGATLFLAGLAVLANLDE